MDIHIRETSFDQRDRFKAGCQIKFDGNLTSE